MTISVYTSHNSRMKPNQIKFLSKSIAPGFTEADDENDAGFSLVQSVHHCARFGLILLIYSLLGAYVFKVLEDDTDQAKIRNVRHTLVQERIKLARMLQCININETFNSSSESTELIDSLIRDYEHTLDNLSEGALKIYIDADQNPKGRWTYFHSLLFVFTLITTIGYGNLTPQTAYGRMFCISYALLGIPLMLIEIALAGKLLANTVLAVFQRFIKSQTHFHSEKSSFIQKFVGTTLSIFAVLNLLLAYTVIGAFLYDYTEGWGFVNSFYFCFTTLTTVGFGDFVPKEGGMVAAGNPIASLRVIYVLFGLALTSTSFELVRKQYSHSWAKRPIGISIKPDLVFAVQRITVERADIIPEVKLPPSYLR